MGQTNSAPSKEYKSGQVVKMSPLKQQLKSGSISTKRSTPAPSGN